MSDHPDTIRSASAFDRSQCSIECPYCERVFPFDGIFDWSWTQGCFGKTKITPMDFDGVVERKGHYLIFETKDVGASISEGQKITLNNLKIAKSFIVLKIWGKRNPEKMIVCYKNGKEKEVTNINEMRSVVSGWYNWADGFQPISRI